MKNQRQYNILFVFHNPFDPSFGGTERVTDLLSKEFIKRGHNVFYLSTRNKESEYKFPCTQYYLPYSNSLKNSKNYKYVESLIQTNKIDFIINQSGYNHELNEIFDLKCKNIAAIHYEPRCHLKFKFDILDIKNKEKQSIIKFYIKYLIYPLLKFIVRKRIKKEVAAHYNTLAQKANAVVLLSEKYIDEFYSFKVSNGRAKVVGIPNPNVFSNKQTNKYYKEKIVLYVGRLSIIDKNPIRLLEIWEYIFKKYADWKLILVGEGPDQEKLKRYVEERNIENVYFEGRQQDVLSYYQKASFICLTSNTEGFGMTLIEGMSQGCIPFSFNNFAAANDIIIDGENGCLIKPFNIKEYANKLKNLMNDSEKRIKMGMAAQEYVKKYKIDNIVDKWEELFSQL